MNFPYVKLDFYVSERCPKTYMIELYKYVHHTGITTTRANPSYESQKTDAASEIN